VGAVDGVAAIDVCADEVAGGGVAAEYVGLVCGCVRAEDGGFV